MENRTGFQIDTTSISTIINAIIHPTKHIFRFTFQNFAKLIYNIFGNS